MSILPPHLRRFYKNSPMATSNDDNISQNSATSSESPQPSPTPSPPPNEAPTPRRLDKTHGFLKCIIRNQIERDEYHKAIAQNRTERDQRYQKNQVDKKIAQNRYIPPHLRKFASSPSSTESSPQIPFDENSQNDPHYDMRTRARRTLQREGTLCK